MATIIRWSARLLVLILLITVGHKVIDLVVQWLDVDLLPHTEDFLHRSIITATAVYAVLLAVPFVPGAEIGLTLLTVFGGSIAPLIYLVTAASLTVAYAMGRLLPPALLVRGLDGLGLRRAASFVERASLVTYDELQEQLAPKSDSRFVRYLLRFRYVALALAINTPGNVVLGGGGGLALVAGLSRLYSPLPYLLTILIAVLPVPLAFFVGQM